MVNELKDKVIYDELKEFYDRNNGELYSYQDFQKSGIKEFNVVTKKVKELKLYEKNRLAFDFAEILIECVNNHDKIEELEGYISLNPIIDYYESVINLFKGICENEKKKSCIGSLIFKLITESSSSQLIKAGLIIAPIAEIPELESILKVYSIHNEYLFYVLNAYENLSLSNKTFFEIAKVSKGYGRFFAVSHLKPVSYDITEWMIEEGSNNDVAVTELTYLNMLSLNILEYMNKSEFTKEKIEKLSKAFSLMLSDYGLNEIKDEIKVCNKLLDEIDRFIGGIYSLYITISILYSIEAYLIDYYKDKKVNTQLTLYNKYKTIMDKCNKICRKEVWKEIVEDEIPNIEIEANVLITCAEKINYKMKKKDFEVFLKRDYSNPLVYKYAFSVGNKTIKRSAFNIGMNNLNMDEILSGQDELTIDKITYGEIGHICFYMITKYMKYEEFEDEYKEFNLKALKSPLIETRTQAVSNLERIKDTFEPNDQEKIKDAAQNEVVSNIRRGLKSLIISDRDKDKKVVNVEEYLDIGWHVKDIYISTVKVLGEDRYERNTLCNKLLEKDMVYIVNNSGDVEDIDKILVTTNKGVVIGHIPLQLESILRNLMNNGKYFYGKVEKISDNYEEIVISIFLSYKDIIDEIGDTLKLLSDESNMWIQ